MEQCAGDRARLLDGFGGDGIGVRPVGEIEMQPQRGQ
jgi:hypothetical protein